LLRLYRLSGAHSAAAEQYGHYATVMRDELGIEPPPLDSL
jgi:DNA-binding SARP family transcriptional activator